MGMQSEIHWQGIGTRTKASRVDMELKVASHYRTFRGMKCPQTLAMMQKFSIQGLSKKRSYNMNNLPNSLKPA